MATEFNCTINKANQDFDTLTLWEAAIQSDFTSAQTRVYLVASITGTVADGATVVGQNNSYTATIRHVNNSNTSPYQVLLFHDTGAEVFENNEELWVDDIDNTNMVTLAATAGDSDDTAIAVAECYDDDGALADNITVDGSTADATNYVKITVPSSDRHDGTVSSGFQILGSANPIVSLNDASTVIEWVVINGNNGSRVGLKFAQGGLLAEKCIIYNCRYSAVEDNANAVVTLHNCLVIRLAGNGSDNGFSFGNNGVTLTAENCTAWADPGDGSNGFRFGGSGTKTLKNCISQGFGTEDFVAGFAGTHNVGEHAAEEMAFGDTWATGTADTDTENKLEDSGADFVTDGVQVGSVVKNTTDNTYGYVTVVTATALTLDSDVFPDGDEGYIVYTNMFGAVSFVAEGTDFHLDPSDTVAQSKGIDLSGEFTDDIDGDTRSVPWDIGIDQIAEVSTAGIRRPHYKGRW